MARGVVDRVLSGGLFIVIAVLVVLGSIVIGGHFRRASGSSTASSFAHVDVEEERSRVREYLRRNNIVVPLRQDLGQDHLEVGCSSPLAERYFQQGLRLLIAYQFPQAVTSFLQCQTLDQRCGMCAWGESVARGPNLNDFPDVSEDNVRRARDAAQRAVIVSQGDRAKKGWVFDSWLAELQRGRWGGKEETLWRPKRPEEIEERQRLMDHYADTIWEKSLSTGHSDPWLAYWAAEAQMMTSPWNYWEEQLPGAGVGVTLRSPRIVRVPTLLNATFDRIPLHAGALHLQVHLWEAARDPSPSVRAAQLLDGLVPGSEHLQHMPSHAYARMGWWSLVVRSNMHARLVPQSEHAYPEHNVEMIVYAETAAANEAGASEASDVLHSISESLLISTGRDGYEAIFPYERFVVSPLYVATTFGNWTYVEMRARNPPPKKRIFETAVLHWAIGTMRAHQNRIEDAKKSQKILELSIETFNDASVIERYSATLFPAKQILQILDLYLQACISRNSREESDTYLDHLAHAAKANDAMYYDEPPSLFFPAHVVYGVALREAGRTKDAQAVIHQALDKSPNNQWVVVADKKLYLY